MSAQKVSIIIPVRQVGRYLLEALEYLEKIDWPDYEIIVVADRALKNFSWPKVRLIASGQTGPAQKRDLGAKHAKGEILAFLDDDAYPNPDWLKKAVKHFEDKRVSAVGGPGVTPPNANFWEQSSGWVSASPLGAGLYTYRFLPGKAQKIDDYPSMNLLVRKSDFVQIGGFDSHYYPGEDTKLCLDLINLGKQIIYEPEALVYHHRRSLWLPHLKQNGNFGLHRGFFAKRLPQTSAKLIFFMPSGLAAAVLVFLCQGFGWPLLKSLSQLALMLYTALLVVNGIWIGLSSKSLAQALIALPAVFLTHFWYGLRFIQGFCFVKKLKQ